MGTLGCVIYAFTAYKNVDNIYTDGIIAPTPNNMLESNVDAIMEIAEQYAADHIRLLEDKHCDYTLNVSNDTITVSHIEAGELAIYGWRVVRITSLYERDINSLSNQENDIYSGIRNKIYCV